MGKHVRHIWAKANQHISVHRARPQSSGGKGKDEDKTLFIIIAVIVLIWIIL